MSVEKWKTLKNNLSEGCALLPETYGIYIIKREKPIGRAVKTDSSGILYIGQASNLQKRLIKFRNCNHIATRFLRNHTAIVRSILGEKDLEVGVGKLTVKFLEISSKNKKKLDEAERATLLAYVNKFGEVPPLNFSMPKRLEKIPPSEEVFDWAKGGLK